MRCSVCLNQYEMLLTHFSFIGELKSTKAYLKWSSKVSETKPPTSPLRKRVKWVFCSFLSLINSELSKSVILKYFAGQINSQNQIYMQSYLSVELRGKIGLILCSQLWCLNTVGVVLLLQNPVKKNLKLHRRSLKAVEFPKNQNGSNFS